MENGTEFLTQTEDMTQGWVNVDISAELEKDNCKRERAARKCGAFGNNTIRELLTPEEQELYGHKYRDEL